MRGFLLTEFKLCGMFPVESCQLGQGEVPAAVRGPINEPAVRQRLVVVEPILNDDISSTLASHIPSSHFTPRPNGGWLMAQINIFTSDRPVSNQG